MTTGRDAAGMGSGGEEISTAEEPTTATAYVSVSAASNPYRSYQWYLDGNADGSSNGTGANIDAISTEYTGAGVRIGLVDEGFAVDHPDLAGQFDLGGSYDPRDHGTTDIRPDNTAAVHGTWVAGVIGAAGDNDFGIVGVAPGATLEGFYTRYGAGGSSRAEVADLLARQVNVDISNNSWGYTTEFADNFRDATWASLGNALENSATNGRDGLGTVTVFAAGNDRQYVANTLTYDGDNTNYHSLTNSRFVITAAASTADGHIASFSTPGASILVTAPGQSILTTALDDGNGNPADDYAFVTGTSFSAPIVSGVVAMMLEANPNLGYRDVQEILALSAKVIDAPSASWATNGASTWNGGGHQVSHDFGFGLVDAHAAVRLAETWTMQHTAANEAVIDVPGSLGAGNTLPNLTTRSYALTVSSAFEGFSIDWVEIDLSLTQMHIGDLHVELVSPTGTHSVLVDRPADGHNTRNELSFTFSTNHDWDESPVGTWTLIVSNTGTAGTGTVASLGMHIYGDDQGQDDTYLYTNDFATLSGARGSIDDLAGTDTINAAAVTSDLALDLRPGAVSIIAGRAVVTTAGTVIENVYGGDGDDTITGNDADNHLHGGRGDDMLSGGVGNDTLEGGAGADTLVGGIGDDTYVVDLADTIVEQAGGGTDTVEAAFTYTLGAHVENLVLTGTGDIDGTGNELDNVIVSNHGVDVLTGGDGNDTYFVHNVHDQVIETVSGGVDTVYTDVDFALPDNVERLVLIDGDAPGAAAANGAFAAATATAVESIYGTGNALDNFITGNSANNMLDGLAGADIMVGGLGNDTYFVDNTGDAVVEQVQQGSDTVLASVSYTLSAEVENLWLRGTDNIDGTGNALDNMILGNAGNNVLDGGDGNDGLAGGGGDDVLRGGAGVDWLYGGDGNDALHGGANLNALFGQDGDDTLFGGDDGNGLDGGAGNDTIHGGAGTDWLFGQAGNDTLYGGGSTDALFGGDGNDQLDGGDGGDGLDGGAGDDVLDGGNGVDWLYGGDGNDTLNGGADTDALFGQDGDDVLDGGDGGDGLDGGNGNDVINGGGGNDWLYGQAGDDRLDGGADADVLFGGDGNDVLLGGAAGDSLDGGAGDDVLNGGAGVDVLFGGEGHDAFVFTNPADGGDVIRDFVSGVDGIWLDHTGFGLTTTGPLPADMFQSGNGLPTSFAANSPIFYVDNANHALWFDANGGSSSDAQFIAGFEKGVPNSWDIYLI